MNAHARAEAGPDGRPAPSVVTVDAARALALARQVLTTEAAGISALTGRLAAPFVDAIALVLRCRGRVVVSGIGKSGHVARKLAATLASTGTPAFFVHPAEAGHGDLGMITPDDVVVMLSNSGETDELTLLTPHLKRQGAALIAITGNEKSSLAQSADVHLDAAVDAEACPLGLAPTASTTAMLALGDALALALLDARGFKVEDFARAHPGGALGRKLLTRVEDIMRTGSDLPIVERGATLAQAVVEMSGKGMGMTAVVGAGGTVAGIFTDGDLRRCLDRVHDVNATPIIDVMTRTPRHIEARASRSIASDDGGAAQRVIATAVVGGCRLRPAHYLRPVSRPRGMVERPPRSLRSLRPQRGAGTQDVRRAAMTTIENRARDVRLLTCDVDGVLTDDACTWTTTAANRRPSTPSMGSACGCSPTPASPSRGSPAAARPPSRTARGCSA
jgi:arabinose-5-phosphate isomerase